MTPNKRFIAISLLAGCFLAPGLALAQNYPPVVTQMVAAAKKQVKTIDMAQFKAGFDKKELGLIVDVRDPDEYAEGHIPARSTSRAACSSFASGRTSAIRTRPK